MIAIEDARLNDVRKRSVEWLGAEFSPWLVIVNWRIEFVVWLTIDPELELPLFWQKSLSSHFSDHFQSKFLTNLKVLS